MYEVEIDGEVVTMTPEEFFAWLQSKSMQTPIAELPNE